MNSLPIELTRWRDDLKERIRLEASVLRALIQWGMVESACEVCRGLEAHFEVAPEGDFGGSSRQRLSAQDKAFVRDLLQEAYLRTREIPRHRIIQERLHDGLLTGFEELALEVIRCYEEFSSRTGVQVEREKAA